MLQMAGPRKQPHPANPLTPESWKLRCPARVRTVGMHRKTMGLTLGNTEGRGRSQRTLRLKVSLRRRIGGNQPIYIALFCDLFCSFRWAVCGQCLSENHSDTLRYVIFRAQVDLAGHGRGDERGAVFLEAVDGSFDLGDQAVNLDQFTVKKGCNRPLLIE